MERTHEYCRHQGPDGLVCDGYAKHKGFHADNHMKHYWNDNGELKTRQQHIDVIEGKA